MSARAAGRSPDVWGLFKLVPRNHEQYVKTLSS